MGITTIRTDAKALAENGAALDAIALRSERAHAATDMLVAYLEKMDERIAFPDIHPGTFKSLLLGVLHELDEISDLTTTKPRNLNVNRT